MNREQVKNKNRAQVKNKNREQEKNREQVKNKNSGCIKDVSLQGPLVDKEDQRNYNQELELALWTY